MTRARAQFDAGLIDEARGLRDRFDPGLPAFSAIGYREAWAVLDGELTRDAAIDLDAQRNLAFSKRQRTWFRSEPDITWLDATEGLPTETALELVGPLLYPSSSPRIDRLVQDVIDPRHPLDDGHDRVPVVVVVDDPADDRGLPDDGDHQFVGESGRRAVGSQRLADPFVEVTLVGVEFA